MDTENTPDDQIESQVEAPVAEAQGSVPQEAPQATPWEAFKRLPEFQGQDDRAIAARLYSSMEREKAASRHLAQYQQYMPYAQEYLQHRPQFQEYLKWRDSQSQQPQQPQQPQFQPQQQEQQKKWWNPPEVREAYKKYLIKDDQGRDVIDPDAPLDARHSLYEYMQYKADFARNFLEDPEKALGPMVQELAAKQAQQLIQEKFTEAENVQYVNEIQDSNKDWIFDPETGDVTPEGALVHKYIEQARDSGIQGPKARWEYAVAMTERELLAQRFDEEQQSKALYQQAEEFFRQNPEPPAPPPPPQAPAPKPDPAQQNMQYLRREASRNPSRSAGAANPDPRAPKPKMSFEQMLREDASSRGLI